MPALTVTSNQATQSLAMQRVVRLGRPGDKPIEGGGENGASSTFSKTLVFFQEASSNKSFQSWIERSFLRFLYAKISPEVKNVEKSLTSSPIG